MGERQRREKDKFNGSKAEEKIEEREGRIYGEEIWEKGRGKGRGSTR